MSKLKSKITKIKKTLLKIILISVFLIINLIPKKSHAALDETFGLDKALKSIMHQGNHIVCLKADTKNVVQPSSRNWKIPAKGKIRLFGANCYSPNGCKIFRCNSSNYEIDSNEHLLKKCKSEKGSEQWAGCKNEDKIKKLEEKNNNSIQVEPGCQEVKNFTVITKKSNNYLSVYAEENQSSNLPVGPVNVELEDQYVIHVNYQYYLSQPAEEIKKYQQTDYNITPGEDDTLKLSTFNLNLSDKEIEGSIKDCQIISWDPFGRVFDAVSLEPISNVKVILIDHKINQPAKMRFSDNYDITDIRGIYNILVEEAGFYRLEVEPPDTHQFKNNIKLHPNYQKIYSNIYEKGKVFEEKVGIPTQHDIPLVPIKEPYRQAIAELIPNTLESYASNTYIVYKGVTTFPYAKVCLINSQTNNIVGSCTNADKIGIFTLVINKKLIPYEFLQIGVQKVDLTDFKKTTSNMTKQNNLGYQPILSYIEGYAYDDQGNLLLNTQVNIKLKNNHLIFSQTKTDENGYFKFAQDQLPFNEYYLDYLIDDNNHLIKNTSEFVKENLNFIKQNNIDLFKLSDQSVNNNNTYYQSKPLINNYQSLKKTFNNFDKKSYFLVYLIIFLIFSLTLILIISLYIYIKYKEKKSLT